MSSKIKYYTNVIMDNTNKAKAWVKKHSTIILTVLFLLLAFTGLIFVFVYWGKNNPVPGIVKPDKEIIHDVKVIVDNKRVDSLHKIDSLKTVQIKSLTVNLKAAQQKNKELAEKYQYEDFINETDVSDHTAADYFEEIKASARASDSACNVKIEAMDQQMAIKDSIGKVLAQDKMMLISSFNQMAFNNQAMNDEIKKLNRKLRGGKVVKGALVATVVYMGVKLLSK